MLDNESQSNFHGLGDENEEQHLVTTEKFLQHLIDLSKSGGNIKSSDILKGIKIIFNSYHKYVGEFIPLKLVYEEIMKLFDEKYSIISNQSIELILEQNLNDMHIKKKFNNYFNLFQIIIRQLLDQNILKKHFFDKIQIDDCTDFDLYKYNNSYIDIDNSYLFSESNISCKVLLDKNFDLVLEKTYSNGSQNIDELLIKKEKRIFKGNYSKFIVNYIDENKSNSIILPYFPLGNINKILAAQNQDENIRILALVDKIVIICEILEAFIKLHSHGEFHGDFCSNFVFVNSNKDAYIGLFTYNSIIENDSTKPNGPFYYRSPKYRHDIDRNGDFDIQLMQSNDIYSLGVLMHEIITETMPENRMKNMARAERIKILKSEEQGSTYADFLFSRNNNEVFLKGSEFFGFKEIIQKCMNTSPNDNFASMKNVLDSIHQLQIYKDNKIEIEYRIKNAISGSDYRCSFSNLVESYLMGQSISSDIICKILHLYNNDFHNLQVSDDIFKQIFETLEIKNEEDYTYVFQDIFDFIIYKFGSNASEGINDNYVVNTFETLSMRANNEASDDVFTSYNMIQSKCIEIPYISSISDFNKNGRTLNEVQSLFWSFFIAKELLLIHSNDLYHGELSNDSIGIYFNKETKTFIPSIILFYHHFNKVRKSKCQINFQQFDSEQIEKYQKKDMKCFYKIVSNFEGMNPVILNQIKKCISMNTIVFHLYNYILKSQSPEVKNIFLKNYSKHQYSAFQISYSDLKNICTIAKSSNFSDNVLLRISFMLSKIQNFLSNSILDKKSTIKENIMNENEIQFGINPALESIFNQIEYVKEKSSTLCNLIYQEIEISYDDNSELIINNDDALKMKDTQNHFNFNEPINQENNFNFNFILKSKKKKKQKRKWFFKILIRRLEIFELNMQSFNFLMRRYLLNLNPNLNYKLIITIKNKMFSKYQNVPIKGENVIQIANELGYVDNYYENGDIVIMIKNKCS